jgi:transposase
MTEIKYIGMDVHKATIRIAILNQAGKLVMEVTIRTEGAAVLEFFHGMRGSLQVAFEESTQAQWLYELLTPVVSKVVVCDPRQFPGSRSDNKSDSIDARKLAHWLRSGDLKPVYHQHTELGALQQLAASYVQLSNDATRAMNRLKAIYRGRAIECAGARVYSPKFRQRWLQQLPEAAARRRAERLYAELDAVLVLRKEARQEMVVEGRRHPAYHLLCGIPQLGPVRVALLLALLKTPHRFRTKRQLWTYAGLSLVTRSSADEEWRNGELQRSRRPALVLGLNRNCNHAVKAVFKGAAIGALRKDGPWKEFYTRRTGQGMRPSLAIVTLARKIAAVTLTVWKKGEPFDVEHLTSQAA